MNLNQTLNLISSIQEGKIKISQIFRNFILAEKYGNVHGLKGVYSVVMAPTYGSMTGT